jgi:hypothetical protein
MFFREHRRLLAYSQHLINAKAISGVVSLLNIRPKA